MSTPLAFSPGSLTCFFRPTVGPTAAETFSRGCAVCIDQGVTAAVEPAAAIGMTLNGRAVEIEPVRAVLAALAPEPVRVRFETPLPLGCGFGVSGACCLATAFALDRRFGQGMSRHELGLAAHAAEVGCRTGFGDVAAQLCGGVVARRCRTGPLDAEQLPLPTGPLFHHVTGEIRTSAVLGNPAALARIQAAGDAAMRWLEADPAGLTLDRIMDRSVEFAEAAGVLTSTAVRSAIAQVQAVGGHGMMILLGHSVLATAPAGPGPWTACSIDPHGTRHLP